MVIVGVAVALVAGLIMGFGLARRWPANGSDTGSPDAARRDVIREPAESARIGATDGPGELLRDAVDHLEIGVLVASPSGTIAYRNHAADAFRGTHIGVLIDDEVTAIIAQTQSGERAERVVELQGPPKTWLAISADPTPDGSALVTTQDISERVRIDAMRTDFVTNISHELKTPVGAVAVLAEALIDETDPEVVHRLADHLVEESHRAVRTIDDLLKLSQIESARPGDGVVDLSTVIETAIGRGRSVDAGRGVQISTFDAPESVRIRGDERQLVSAVGNLVENAVKYSGPDDVVQVRVRVDDNAVEIMVADQGIGIPARDLDRIFERFYRVDKARSRETGGTGLGLSIVRHVATNHGGEVLVSSHEGEGSTFVLRIPASLVVDGAVDDDIPILGVEQEETRPHE